MQFFFVFHACFIIIVVIIFFTQFSIFWTLHNYVHLTAHAASLDITIVSLLMVCIQLEY